MIYARPMVLSRPSQPRTGPHATNEVPTALASIVPHRPAAVVSEVVGAGLAFGKPKLCYCAVDGRDLRRRV